MKLIIKFYLCCMISLNFDTYFFEFLRDIVYSVISLRQLFTSLAFRKCKKAVKYLNLFWNKGFVLFSLKLVESLLDFVLSRLYVPLSLYENATANCR